MQNDEIQRKIEALKKQVARTEAKGNFNTAHHRVLASYLKSVGDKIPRNADKKRR